MLLTRTHDWGNQEVQLLRTHYHCINCGSQSVFETKEEGDYYLGNDYLCTECNSTFVIPGGISTIPKNWTIKTS